MAHQERASSFGNDLLFEAIVRATQDQPFLETSANVLQPAVRSVLRTSRGLRNFLHGVWVGHPLHPVLTDIPIGAWTMACIFDAIHAIDRKPHSAYAADACVTAGIVGAAAAAVTGLADWSETHGRPARNGLVHATSNTVALSCYITSLVMRKRNRPVATLLSFAGYAMAGIGAGLGGHLVFGEGQGVNHAIADELSEEWTRMLPLDELTNGKLHRANVGDHAIVLVRQDDQTYALLERCAHLGGPLSEGRLEDCSITCPWHGSRFSLIDGHVIDGPATCSQPTFETRVNDGYVEVRAFEAEAP